MRTSACRASGFELWPVTDVVDSGASMMIRGVPSVTNSKKAVEAVVGGAVVVVVVVVVAVVTVGLVRNGLAIVEGRTGVKLVVEGG